MCKAYYYVLKNSKCLYGCWIYWKEYTKKLVASVASGEKKLKAWSQEWEGPSRFMVYFCIFLKFCTIYLYDLRKKKKKRRQEKKKRTTKQNKKTLPIEPAKNNSSSHRIFGWDILMEGVRRDLFLCPEVWNPCLPFTWHSQVDSTGDCPHRQGTPDFP